MEETPKREQMPQGRKKGGTRFPRMDLEQAYGYAQKLVAKTHVGPQPAETILPGVFGSAGSAGKIRASAMKQYELMEGKTDAYTATTLARQVVNAPEEEQILLFQEACLKPRVFKSLFDTYHGDTVSIAKLRQHAGNQGVHPDETQNCVDIFVASAEFAKLGQRAADGISLRSAPFVRQAPAATDTATDPGDPEEEVPAREERDDRTDAPGITESNNADDRPSARSIFQVNLTLDSSMDTDKLQKQLEILRRYGAI